MELSHMTPRDETLTHQVVFTQRGGGGQNVSCNCRATVGEHEKAGKFYYSPMGESRNIETSRELYNNPDNHFAPFSDEDRAKW